MAKTRTGHFAEAQVLEALEVDYIDESEVLTPADEAHHIDKWAFKVPFVCGRHDLGEALRRIDEGAALIRSKGEAWHRRHRRGGAVTCGASSARSAGWARSPSRSCSPPPRSCALLTISWSRSPARASCPVPLFCAGGRSPRRPTPLLVMQLGAESVFVGA